MNKRFLERLWHRAHRDAAQGVGAGLMALDLRATTLRKAAN
jgi:hypothetical protein